MPPNPSAAEDTDDSPERRPAGWAAGLQALGQVLAQTTLIVAVLYYFGWARSYALYPYFGIEPSMLRFSVADYVLRSVTVTVQPLVIAALAVLGLPLAHRLLKRAVARQVSGGHRLLLRAVVIGCAGVGITLCVAGLLGFYNVIVYSTRQPIVPILIGAGVVLVVYAISWRGATPEIPAPAAIEGLQAAVLVVLAAVLILWAVGVYANLDGTESARTIERRLAERPPVTVYSKTDLSLSAPGTGLKAERLRVTRGEYVYRYTGLRLLTYSNGRYILLPEHWAHARDPAFVLDERDGLRFEIRHA
ncbi:hypothetical protein [Actinomadura fibrosa]|uniref:DUF5671 domain-containing protein n=1 Tax=Actinomadura fibrosa TaxID=111802 RepID=A0ABW2XQI7_9ACTN|nr:hypothetical protein [Actinomadura fibrosa]